MLITRNRTTRDRNFRLYIRMQIWKNILGCQPHTFCCFGSDLRNQDTRPSSDGKNGTVKRRRHTNYVPWSYHPRWMTWNPHSDRQTSWSDRDSRSGGTYKGRKQLPKKNKGKGSGCKGSQRR